MAKHTKETLTSELVATYLELDALITPLAEEQFVIVGITPEWSLRDVCAHLGVWMRRAIAKIAEVPMPPSRRRHEKESVFWDRVNEFIIEDARKKPISLVTAEFRAAYQETITYIGQLSDMDIDNQDLMDTLYINSVGHMQDHLTAIRPWIAQLLRSEPVAADVNSKGQEGRRISTPSTRSAASLRIFISHNRADNVFCRALADALSAAGADVWIDLNQGPYDIMTTVSEELRSHPIFIVVLSPDALKPGWVRDESMWAYRLYADDPERSRIILPVVARAVRDSEIWVPILNFKYVGGDNWTALGQAETIRRTLEELALVRDQAVTTRRAFTVLDLLDRGTLMIQQKRYRDALTFANAAVLLDEGYTYGWSSKARAHNYLGEIQDTADASEKAITLDPNNAMGWNYSGNALNDQERYDKAIEAFDLALELNSAYAFPWNNKGYALHCLHRDQEALDCYDNALTLNPEFTLALINKGCSLGALGRLDEALSAFEHAIAITPRNSLAWHYKIETLREMGRKPEADAALAAAQTQGLGSV